MPRIESVVPLAKQPQADAKTTIWYDDFETAKKYSEEQGGREGPGLGGGGEAMTGLYEKDQQGLGNRKVFFGDSPVMCIARKGEKFTDIYWRVYVKHQAGWVSGQPGRGGPDKLSRATSMVNDKWNQAMFAHVWSSGDALTLDNASGVNGGAVVTTRYNDFDNMKWVGGNKPVSPMLLHSSAEAGWWVCVEARARLNTPGNADALSQLWIDGKLQCERKDFDWRGTYDAFGINAVFLETYWNNKSPVTQKRCTITLPSHRTRGAGYSSTQPEFHQDATGRSCRLGSGDCGRRRRQRKVVGQPWPGHQVACQGGCRQRHVSGRRSPSKGAARRHHLLVPCAPKGRKDCLVGMEPLAPGLQDRALTQHNAQTPGKAGRL